MATKGREKIDLHADVNLGVFGLLRPDNLNGLVTGDKAKEALSLILKEFTFPSLNIIFSAAARMRPVDNDKAKVETILNQMELRASLTPLDAAGKEIKDPHKCSVLGIFPFETTAAEKEPAVQMTPNVSGLLGAVPGLGGLTGIVSALGLTFAPLFKPKFPILSKAFMAGPREFGWYLKSFEKDQKEGVRYGVTFLQVHRDVATLRVKIVMASDWDKGDVDLQNEPATSIDLKVHHPKIPDTPQISDFTSPSELSLVIPREDVRALLALTDKQLDDLIGAGRLVAFGPENKVISKGSLLKLLEVPFDSD